MTSVFHASDLLLIMNFVITLSKLWIEAIAEWIRRPGVCAITALQARDQVSTVLIFVVDNPEEHERLELRSRTEVRLTEGETEESVIYQFSGKTATE